MALKRYTLTVEDNETGRLRKYNYRSRLPLISEHSDLLVAFTVSLRRLAIGLAVVIGFPILFAISARWSVQAELQAAKTLARTYEVENTSYKAMTGELAGQIYALQSTVAELDQRARIDPAAAQAIPKLPAVIRNRAMGGGGAVPLQSMLGPSFPLPEDNFGVLRELLQHLETRLQLMRGDVEKRAQLAAATPTGWPAIGWLSAAFGRRDDPFTGNSSFHTGLDISADRGTPVRATADGRVDSASYQGDYGNLLVIDHGYGLSTRYGHLSAFAVKPGARIKKGEVVGFIGTTGRTTGPHLHYEILVNGQAINPAPFAFEPRRP